MVSRRVVVVVGDALIDRDIDGDVNRVSPDAPVPVVDARGVRSRPGGAGLAAALLAACGRDVALVTALADDEPGHELAELLAKVGVEVCDVGLGGRTPEKVRIRSAGQSLLRLDHGGEPGRIGTLPDLARRVLAAAGAVLVADYGRGLAAHAELRASLEALPTRVPIVWDPHPRGPAPIDGVRLATPNAAEAARLVPEVDGLPMAAAAARAELLRDRWQAGGVAVTLGARGALLAGLGGPPLVVPAPEVEHGDACGAGDCFAGAATLALADGAVLSEAVEAAVIRASGFVGAGGAAAFLAPDPIAWPATTDAEELARRVRSTGGTVVATGGCFDLLHAGHVAALLGARRLGDCLVVCLNSDASVRRLKGPDRPLQPAADRAAVLLALDCVDAVFVFDEDTPAAALVRLRPDVFCKGADYGAADLPEAEVVAQWGGQAVVLPYLPGRSTTRLIEEAARRGS
ncbi:MAG: putative bifunctional cytidylyltransferase/PfkB-family carbohydrate kinase [Acidimicrobiales bacterium]|nr:putative bifunctional cytidylyltransferase/PfkB-family carbohydrate kinase [Acidimicrobiales bacterium]